MAYGKAHMKKVVFEVAVNAPASRVWRAYVDELPRTLLAATPDHFERVELVEGDTWAKPGSVLHVKLGKSMGCLHGLNFTKIKFEHKNEDNLEVTWRTVEGFGLGTYWLSLSHNIKVKGVPHTSSSMLIHTLEFESIGEHDLHEVYKEQAIQFAHALESFLNTNPNFGCVPN